MQAAAALRDGARAHISVCAGVVAFFCAASMALLISLLYCI